MILESSSWRPWLCLNIELLADRRRSATGRVTIDTGSPRTKKGLLSRIRTSWQDVDSDPQFLGTAAFTLNLKIGSEIGASCCIERAAPAKFRANDQTLPRLRWIRVSSI